MSFLKRFFFVYLVLIVSLLFVELWARYADINFSISPIFYWMFLFAWLLAIFIWKLTSNFSLKLGFILTLLGMSVFVLVATDFAEVLLRLGFVGWLVGIIQAIIEYKSKNVKK